MKTEKQINSILAILKELFPNAYCVLQYSNPWELLVAVILSAQCTDKMVNNVTQNLFKKYNTLDDYAYADISELEKDIYQTGFFRNKAKHIIQSAKIIRATYHGKVPSSMNELIALPGVGRKTANVVLGNAFGIVEGIAVDTHVKRLSKILGLTKSSDPIQIEKDLMRIIPKKEWFVFTYRMIEYGRTYCKAKKHDHERCPLKSVEIS